MSPPLACPDPRRRHSRGRAWVPVVAARAWVPVAAAPDARGRVLVANASERRRNCLCYSRRSGRRPPRQLRHRRLIGNDCLERRPARLSAVCTIHAVATLVFLVDYATAASCMQAVR